MPKVLSCLLALTLAWSLAAPARAMSETELEPLCAPYALYPDTLLAQVLAASTYPNELQAAGVWENANPGMQGSALESALASQNWDSSVKALCAFPDVVKKMTDNLESTRSLGDAFLQEKGDVMDCVQNLRARAQAVGALTTTSQQSVTGNNGFIQIQPAQQSTLYVPMYDPSDLYMGGAYGANWLSFGTGVALGSIFNNNYGAFDWANHGLYTGAAVRAGVWGGGYNYAGVNSWGHNYASPAYRSATTAAYRGPNGATAVYRSNAGATYRGYGGATVRQTSVFSGGERGFRGGGFESRSASRGWGSMGGGRGHFGGGGRRR